MENSINNAIRKGYLYQVRFLIQLGYDVNVRDENGRTPIVNCALISDDAWAASLTRLLMQSGAKIVAKDRLGYTALHYAVLCDHEELVDILTQAADFDLNEKDNSGNTALHISVAKGNTRITRRLVNGLHRYKQKLTVLNGQGYTPFAVACRCRQEECARILLEDVEVEKEANKLVKAASCSDEESAADFVLFLLSDSHRCETDESKSNHDTTDLSLMSLGIERGSRLRIGSSVSSSTSKLLNSRPRATTTSSLTFTKRRKDNGSIRGGAAVESHKSSDDSQSATVDKSIVNMKMLDAIRIRPMSSKFPRNDPNRILFLNRKVIDHCVEVPNQALITTTTTTRSRPKEAEVEKQTTNAKISAENWREFLQGVTDNLSYQYSHAYRPTAQPQTNADYFSQTNPFAQGGNEDDATDFDKVSVVNRRMGAGGRRISRLGSAASVRNFATANRHKK